MLLRPALAVIFTVGSLAACGPLDDQSTVQPSTASASTEDACAAASDPFSCTCEQVIVTKSNAMRAEVGKEPLAADARIATVSRLWSAEQARRGEISHDWFADGTWGRKYKELFDQRSPAIAENVAMNSGFETPEACGAAFARQWRNSAGHYRNIIDRDNHGYKTLGVGVVRKANGHLYATQNFGR